MVYFQIAIILAGFTVAGYGGLKVHDGYVKHRRNKAIKTTDPVPPSDVEPGSVAVRGVIEADESIPVGSNGSVAIESEIWEHDLGEDNNYVENGDLSTTEFSIVGDEGKITVEPEGVSVEASSKRTTEESVAVDNPPSSLVQEYIDWKGLKPQPEEATRDYELQRAVPGDDVTIFGTAKNRNGSTVLTDDGEFPFFATDIELDRLLQSRKSVFAKRLLLGVPAIVIGTAILLGGILVLIA